VTKGREWPFPFRLALALALSAPYSNSSRREFTAEAQRGKRSPRKKRRLNTKAQGHKGQREKDAWEKFKFESKFK